GVIGRRDADAAIETAQLTGVAAHLVLPVHPEADELEPWMVDDSAQREPTDVAGAPLDDTMRHAPPCPSRRRHVKHRPVFEVQRGAVPEGAAGASRSHMRTSLVLLTGLLLLPVARPAAWAEERTPAKAAFAGGCFWCMQPAFEALDGVTSVTAGYTGGTKQNPTYEEVSEGGTGHAESIEVVYDPTKISYDKLLDVFWHNVDPTDARGQFCDHGNQYRTAIFYYDDTQKRLAEASKQAIAKSLKVPGPIVTEIVPAGQFWPPEQYHQDYSKKNRVGYRFYRYTCGRDKRLEEVWGAAPAH